MRRKRTHYTYKSTIFLYLMILTFIPIVVLGTYSYHTYMREVSKKLFLSADGAVKQTRSNVDYTLTNIRRYYTGETLSEEVEWMLSRYMDYSQYSYLKKATDSMAGGYLVSDYISGYNFINFNTNWILGNHGMYRYSHLKNKEEIEELFENDIKEGYFDHTFWEYFPESEREEGFLEREKIILDGLCLIYKLPVTNKTTYAMMIIQVNMNEIYKLLEQGVTEQDITVCNSRGDIIYTTNQAVANEISRLKAEKVSLKDQKRIQTADQHDYLIATSESNVLDWTYVISNDYNAVRGEASNILSFMGCLLFLIVIATLIALGMTKKLYAPVSKLKDQVSEIQPDESGTADEKDEKEHKNELEYISEQIDKLVDNNAMLENLMSSQQSQLIDLFQMRLIRGEIKQEEIREYLERFHILEPSCYSTVSIIIKQSGVNRGLFSGADDTEQDALRIDLVENLPKELKDMFLMSPICYTSAIFAMVGAKEEEQLNEKIMEVYDCLDHYTQEKYQSHISMGVSSIHTGLDTSRAAYHESIEALKGKELAKKGQEETGLSFYLELMQKESSYSYNRPAEREIKMYVDKSDKEGAHKAIDEFLDELIEKNVSQSEMQLHLQRLVVAILLIATDAGIPTEKVFKEDIGMVFMKFNQLYDLHKIKSYLKYHIANPIMDSLSEYRLNKSTNIVAEVKKLIQENDGDISLAECAEKLGYHPTYLWKILKMENNTNFSDYMGNYKLEEAKRYLLETDMTIHEIAEHLKYTNSQNFIRFFNKMEGMTPGKYRQMHKKKG